MVNRGEYEPSQRQLRVAEQMRHLLAEQLLRGELRDPRLVGRSLTVAEVRVSRDLKSATVYTTELGGELTREVAAHTSGASAARASHRGRTKPAAAPRLQFVADETFAHAAHIDRLLHEAQRVGLAQEDDSDGAA